jgi:hypothetical protein
MLRPSPARDDLHNFQPVTSFELALVKFGWRDGFAVMFDDDAPRQELLRKQKFLESAGERSLDQLAVGNDVIHTPRILGKRIGGSRMLLLREGKFAGGERGIPIFPHWFITKLPNASGDLARRTRIGDIKLSRRAEFGRGPLAGAQFDDVPPFGVVQVLFARAGISARFGVTAGAQ